DARRLDQPGRHHAHRDVRHRGAARRPLRAGPGRPRRRRRGQARHARDLSLLLQPAPVHARRDPREVRPRAHDEEETTMRYPLKRLIGSLALVAVTATGGVGGVSPAWAARLNVPTSATPAAGLRVGLNALLSEHVYLAAAATTAALGGRQPEFEAAAAALDANSADVAKAIGSVYGPDAQKAFLPLWRKHIGMVVDYTAGAATQDRARQQKAVSDLVAYTQDLGAFLAGANPNLPKPVVAELVQHHVLTLKAVIDAQAARDQDRAFTALRVGAGHMQTIADPLADAIVKQFPDRFAGAAAAAAGAALGGRDAEFKAAAGALDANSVAVAKAIGSVYGPDAEKAFLPLW